MQKQGTMRSGTRVWGLPKTGTAWWLGQPPRRIGAVKSDEDGGRDTSWGYPKDLFAGLYWYFQGLEWSKGENMQVSWAELALDFEASTGLKLSTPYREGLRGGGNQPKRLELE